MIILWYSLFVICYAVFLFFLLQLYIHLYSFCFVGVCAKAIYFINFPPSINSGRFAVKADHKLYPLLCRPISLVSTAPSVWGKFLFSLNFRVHTNFRNEIILWFLCNDRKLSRQSVYLAICKSVCLLACQSVKSVRFQPSVASQERRPLSDPIGRFSFKTFLWKLEQFWRN